MALDQGSIVDFLLKRIQQQEQTRGQLSKEQSMALFREQLERGRPNIEGLAQLAALPRQLSEPIQNALTQLQDAGIDFTTLGSDPEQQKKLAEINSRLQQSVMPTMIQARLMEQLFRASGFNQEADYHRQLAEQISNLSLTNMFVGQDVLAATREGRGEAPEIGQITLPFGTVSRSEAPEGAPAQPGSLSVTGGPKAGFQGQGTIDQILAALQAFQPGGQEMAAQEPNIIEQAQSALGAERFPNPLDSIQEVLSNLGSAFLSSMVGTSIQGPPGPPSTDEIVRNNAPEDITNSVMQSLGFLGG